jgi:hypothetical protein
LEILQVGEKLKAPINVSGEWEINDEFAKAVDKSCVPVSFQTMKPKLTIEQSGIYLKGILNDVSQTELKGRLKGNKILFSQKIPVRKDSLTVNGNEKLVELSVDVVQSKDKQDELAGEWKITGCSKSGQVKFSAIKRLKE